MTPAARLQAAIDILGSLESTASPADRFLRDWFRARHFMGSKDRAAVAARVYDVLRHRASYGWRMGRDDARSLVIASALAEGIAPQTVADLFSGTGYGPSPLTEPEQQAIVTPPDGEPP